MKTGMQRQILYKCPRTAMNVQQQLDAVPEAAVTEDAHVPVRCPACTMLHFVNISSGKLLGAPSEPRADLQRSA